MSAILFISNLSSMAPLRHCKARSKGLSWSRAGQARAECQDVVARGNDRGSAAPCLGLRIAGWDALTLFGLFAVSAMLVCYALEERSHWFVMLFAASCALGSAYGFLQGAWPFGLVEAVWSVVAFRRWLMARR